MFDSTLLESSPLRSSVLKPAHRLVALGVGALGFLAGWRQLPLLAPYATRRSLWPVAALVGIGLGLYALMVLYVAYDACQLQLHVWWVWTGVTLVFNLAGFLAYLLYSAVRTSNWKRISLPIAYVVEVALIGLLVMLPLIYTQALPRLTLTRILPPPGVPRGHALAQTHESGRSSARTRPQDVLFIPRFVPREIPPITDAPEAPKLVASDTLGDMPGGFPDGVPFSFAPSASEVPSPPIPHPTRSKHSPETVRVGGNVQQAKLIYRPQPEYPPIARMTRVQGTVRLEAVIGTDGTIRHLRVLSGHPLLVNAAVEAVRQWRYQPTLLNGEAVEVLTSIEVNFTLAD